MTKVFLVSFRDLYKTKKEAIIIIRGLIDDEGISCFLYGFK